MMMMKTLSLPLFQVSPPKSTTLGNTPLHNLRDTLTKSETRIGFSQKPTFHHHHSSSSTSSFTLTLPLQVVQKSLPFIASVALLILPATPVKAGILSGFSGIESAPGPQLSQPDFLARFNEENHKKYAENDERFKSSPIVKELLERSKLNKEKNKRAIQDKYCVRGAEWGVGDCSTAGMSPQERDNFIAMLKQKTGIKE